LKTGEEGVVNHVHFANIIGKFISEVAHSITDDAGAYRISSVL
jgi:hypothetical protein